MAQRWTNPSLPQTLQIAVFLLYANTVIGVLFGAWASPVGLLVLVGSGAAGFGISNEKRWGYLLGVGFAALDVAFLVLARPTGSINVISLAFAVALVVLLVHPQSREYQRIWFR